MRKRSLVTTGMLALVFAIAAPAVSRAEFLIEDDRNLDGVADSWEYYERGERQRWELDKNFDGTVDGIITFDKGFVVSSEIDRDLDGVMDIRSFFNGGLRTFNEVDTNGDGLGDNWEYFDSRGQILRTEIDDNFDGTVDRTVEAARPRRRLYEEALLGGKQGDR